MNSRIYKCGIMGSNGQLKNKVIESIVWKNGFKKTGKHEITYNGYLDVLYLLGITDKPLDEKYLRFMNEEELKLYSDVIGINTTKEERLRLCSMKEHERVGFYITMEGRVTELALALNKIFTDMPFSFSNEEKNVHSDNSEEWTVYEYNCNKGVIYHKYTYGMGLKLAEKGAYKEAVQVLWPFAITGDNSALNDVGVCLERLREFNDAAACYRASNLTIAKKNLLKLYDHKQIVFETEDFVKACKFLMKEDVDDGYLYMSYLYQGLYKEKKNVNKALMYIDDALKMFPNSTKLIFEKAYILSNYFNKKYLFEESNKLYRRIVDKTDEEGFTTTAKYNYALHLREGKGCEKDVLTAIKYLVLAAFKEYEDAYKELIDIYEKEDSWINVEQALLWKDLLEILRNKKLKGE